MTAMGNSDMIIKWLMPFLLGHHNGMPNLTIFKLAMTCKKAKKFIEYAIGNMSLARGADYHAMESMIDEFNREPDFKDKVTPSKYYHSLKEIWGHPVFGGSVLNPVHRLDKETWKIDPRPNKLLQNIVEAVTPEWEFLRLTNIKLPVDWS
jgi:hypothetical protein